MISDQETQLNLSTIKNLVILMAMQDEASPIIESLNLKENKQILSSVLPFRCFEGYALGQNNKTLNINLVTSGQDSRYQVDNIGCEAATLMANEAVNNLKPDLILSAGTAGGFDCLGAEIGTIYVSQDYFVFHDRIVPLANFDQSAIGNYPAANLNQLASELNFRTGVISTGSSLEKNSKDNLVLQEHQVVAKEMEAAAIAWVAMLYNVPMAAIKSITNLVDLDNQSEHEFVKNFDCAVSSLQDAILRTIDYLVKRSH